MDFQTGLVSREGRGLLLGWKGHTEKVRGTGRGGGFLPPPAPTPATHLDRLSVAGPQEALVVRFDTEGHEGPRSDVPPIPTRSHALPSLRKQKSG